MSSAGAPSRPLQPAARPRSDEGPGRATWRAASIVAACRAFWRGVRTATGDDAYERYLRHHADAHPGAAPLSPRAYFEAEQRRKWSRINRCC